MVGGTVVGGTVVGGTVVGGTVVGGTVEPTRLALRAIRPCPASMDRAAWTDAASALPTGSRRARLRATPTTA
ncbi:MAG: hypothetical protein M0032_04755, partial [Actinomycetota bacterium]|nr:hypothetical protein [Actinomycetota bacterium]